MVARPRSSARGRRSSNEPRTAQPVATPTAGAPTAAGTPRTHEPTRPRTRWRLMLKELPDLPMGEKDGKPVLLPAEKFSNKKNVENPELEAVKKVGHDPAAIQKAIAGTTASPVCGFKNDKNNVLGSAVTVYKYNPDGSRKLLKKYPLEYIPAAEVQGAVTTTTVAPATSAP